MSNVKSIARTASRPARDRLWRQLRDITGHDVIEVRVTPAAYGEGTVWCAMAIDSNRREIPLPGSTKEVAGLIRRAFVDADWHRAHDYDVTTGALTEHAIAMPGCLLGDATRRGRC